MAMGILANFAVSVWPGILYAATFYKKEHADLESVFWEFEVSIWLNALCRLVSLGIFGVAICRISDCIKQITESATNGTMLCLNWTLVIMAASVQVSLMVFYSLGLAYHESHIFANYTTVMMYVNIVCTCSSHIILAFIFAMMSEPLEVLYAPSKLNSGA